MADMDGRQGVWKNKKVAELDLSENSGKLTKLMGQVGLVWIKWWPATPRNLNAKMSAK